MAYRLDKEGNAIVIDGFDNGIASSPYKGIGSVLNMNTTYYPGVAYVNYRRREGSITLIDPTNIGPITLTTSLSGGATSATILTSTIVTFLTSTGANTWTVPSDWTSTNTIEVIGAGGSGGVNGRGGGGGGGYSKTTNLTLTPSASVDYTIGLGGTGETTNGVAGGDTWFNGVSLGASSVGAKGGAGGTDVGGGQGGQASSGVGSTKNNGGNGGAAGAGAEGGGGGGAAGPNGAGANGVIGSGSANGGAADNGSGGVGGTGGASPTAGGNGTEWDATHGSGGGGGGSTDVSTNGAAGGRYGGGGGGTKKNGANAGGDGFQGVIVITYKSATGNWTYPTGTYQVTFSNGDVRNATFTLNSDAITWSSGLSGSATSTIATIYAMATAAMSNPVQKATSPVGLNYVLDDNGQVWKQTAVNASSWAALVDLSTSAGTGGRGLAFWNNYLVVFRTNRIEFCGDGTGDAGIISTHWNTTTASSTVQFTSSFIIYATAFTGIVSTGATSATLTSAWTGTTGAYTVRFGNGGLDQRAVTFTNGATTATWTGGLSGDAAAQFSMYQLTATTNTFSGYQNFTSGSSVTFSSSGTLPTNLSSSTTYYLISTVDLTGATIFTVSTTYGGTTFVPQTDAGTGTQTMSLLPSSTPPLSNTTITGFSWSSQGVGALSISLATAWLGASGIYNISDPSGNNFTALFTYNSPTVTLTNPAAVELSSAGSFSVQLVNPSATNNKAYVSKVDGNLYFMNGRWLGRISTASNFNVKFNPGIPASFSVNYSVTGALQSQDTLVNMTDLRGTAVLAGNYDIYPWDYVSSQPSAPSPVGEQIVDLVNDLNNVYILAGTKGNVYISNGFSAQLLTKLPDFITGVIDPVWKWGGLMVHRSKLFFQALAQSSAGTNIMAGIFSLIVSPSTMGDTASGLVMEAQNSYGLTPNSAALQNGVLMDNEAWATQDSYYSAWSNSATTGGIDYNDSSGWQNFEATIETDIIPLGTILGKMTMGSIEFKLDRPMVSGDKVRIYWRPSLTDSYTILGTTTTTQLSDYYNSNVTQAQWAQFKVQTSCASSGSSFVPLREIRLHYT